MAVLANLHELLSNLWSFACYRTWCLSCAHGVLRGLFSVGDLQQFVEGLVQRTIHVDHLVKGIIVLRSSCRGSNQRPWRNVCMILVRIYTVYIYIYECMHTSHFSPHLYAYVSHTHKYVSSCCKCMQIILVCALKQIENIP